MRYQYKIGEKICFFQADEALRTAAELLAGILREQEEQHAVLRDGEHLIEAVDRDNRKLLGTKEKL